MNIKDEIEYLRIKLEEIKKSDNWSKNEVFRVSDELDGVIDRYVEVSMKY